MFVSPSKFKAAQQTLHEQSSHIQSLDRSLKDSHLELGMLQSNCTALQDQAEDWKQKWNAERQLWEAARVEWTTERGTLTGQLEEVQLELRAVQGVRDRLTSTVRELQTQIDALTIAHTSLQDTLQTTHTTITDLEAELLSARTTHAQLTSSHASLQAEKAEAEAKVVGMEQELAVAWQTHQTELQRLHQTIADLQNGARLKEEEWQAVRTSLEGETQTLSEKLAVQMAKLGEENLDLRVHLESSHTEKKKLQQQNTQLVDRLQRQAEQFASENAKLLHSLEQAANASKRGSISGPLTPRCYCRSSNVPSALIS
eukprot:NODE_3066_length_1038_cov_20.996707_g2923_i0.p1 GENE.NODE_3066_length_1038_cov_20.996707_g2923_i0~~NODE_3066_length_1038_cov_20.996707_g2923_i0.p1  ORF type:complete len:331 (+),score=108.71 NODE_3066_length_1038_cov_20.996707_g2923_i0:52-993(+)